MYVLRVCNYYLIICCNCRLYSYTFQTLAHKFIFITILNSEKIIDICLLVIGSFKTHKNIVGLNYFISITATYVIKVLVDPAYL